MRRLGAPRPGLRKAGLAVSIALATAPISLTAAAGAAESAQAASARTATVNVVHGIPGLKVKVCVDGQPAIRGFEYGEKAVGVSVPAGTHRVRVVPAGKPCSAPKLLSHRYQLKPGKNYTIVAAVRPDGAPRLAAFGNGVRPTDTGQARLTVRHTAQAPAVNVWAGGTKLIGGSGFSWGDGRTFAVPHDTYRVKVTLPGTKTPVIGPQRLTLRSGKAYQVYAVGTPGHYRLAVVGVQVGTH
jgi:hypothetical protein